jgi:uncharacterized DUF497 family protein
MQFEWDENKNKLNQQKQGVAFEEAQKVFDDPLQISKLDHRFSYFEERWINIGSTQSGHNYLSPIYFLPMMAKKLSASFQHDMRI